MSADSTLLGSRPTDSAGRPPQAELVQLVAGASLSPHTYGWKCANLVRVDSLARRVPAGFAVAASLVSKIARRVASPRQLQELIHAFNALRSRTDLPVVVRSSSVSDDSLKKSLSGLLPTFAEIFSEERLLSAIEECYAGSCSSHVHNVGVRLGVDMPEDHCAVLVQAQIPLEASAIVWITPLGVLIEGFDGPLADPIRGSVSPGYVSESHDATHHVIRRDTAINGSFLRQINELAEAVRSSLLSGQTLSALLEVGFDGERCFVLQVNPLSSSKLIPSFESSPLSLEATPLGSECSLLGAKAAAMKYFQHESLFAKRIAIFPPQTSFDNIEEQLEGLFGNGICFTIRYSNANDIGLPRQFFSDVPAALHWLQKSVPNPNAIIVHEFIEVAHSFELLLTSDSVLLEHIPGMWESDNRLDPDAIHIEGEQVFSWRVCTNRLATFETPAGRKQTMTLPTTDTELHSWAEKVVTIVDRLRTSLAPTLPVNIHFVQDTQGTWHFLNIRPGFRFSTPVQMPLRMHVVESSGDLDTWDGVAKIVLRCSTNRGSENLLIELADRLKAKHVNAVFIDFGLLSHPAMILRDLGLDLVPAYLTMESVSRRDNYTLSAWRLDHGLEPLKRIRSEQPMGVHPQWRIVPDAEPLVEGHLLVVSEPNIPSFADARPMLSTESLVQFLRMSNLSEEGFLYAERGRASFCTSRFTESHAHAHLVPWGPLAKGAIARFIASTKPVEHLSVFEALEHAAAGKMEYIIMGNLMTGPAYLKLFHSGAIPPKRLIRNLFGSV